jgi:hypothetical protein
MHVAQIVLIIIVLWLIIACLGVYFRPKDYPGCCGPAVKQLALAKAVWGMMYFLLLARWISLNLYSGIPKLDDMAWYFCEGLGMLIWLRMLDRLRVCRMIKGND